MKKLVCVLASVMVAYPVMAAPANIAGNWLTDRDRGIVRIAPCGSLLCATITGRGPGIAADAAPTLDSKNPDAALRNRRLIGVVILADGQPEGQHWRGTIYSPDDGRTVAATLTPSGNGALEVRGCWGPFCKTQVWHAAR